MTPLDPRLRAVADAVRPGSVAADVGTDHGYLICHLVASGKCPRGFASDIGVQPLESARRHIREQGLEDKVETVLASGLDLLPGDEVDDIILAGMGGELIAELLLATHWTRDSAKRFLLQPMTRAAHLRRALYRAGFTLLDETAVESGRFVYTVMTAAWTGECRAVTDRFAHTGLLWDKTDPATLAYLDRVRQRLNKQLRGLERARQAGDVGPLRRLSAEIAQRIAAASK